MLNTLVLACALLAAPEPPPAHWVDGVPDVMQMNNYSCGVACTQAIAQRYGHWGYQDEWAKELGTTEADGTHPLKIVNVLRRIGLETSLREGLSLDDLKGMVDRGESVIVDFQAWAGDARGPIQARGHTGRPHDYATEWESGHYCILVGYDKDRLYLEDPSLLGTIGTLSPDDFVARWHDYENENGQRRKYVHAAIVVTGAAHPPPRYTPIE